MLTGESWTRNGYWTIRPFNGFAIWGSSQGYSPLGRTRDFRNLCHQPSITIRGPGFIQDCLNPVEEDLSSSAVDADFQGFEQVATFKGQAILVAPRWPTQYWFRLLQLSRSFHIGSQTHTHPRGWEARISCLDAIWLSTFTFGFSIFRCSALSF